MILRGSVGEAGTASHAFEYKGIVNVSFFIDMFSKSCLLINFTSMSDIERGMLY